LERFKVDSQVHLEVVVSFKDAQISLLEQAKQVSSFEFCSSLKQSFNWRRQMAGMSRLAIPPPGKSSQMLTIETSQGVGPLL